MSEPLTGITTLDDYKTLTDTYEYVKKSITVECKVGEELKIEDVIPSGVPHDINLYNYTKWSKDVPIIVTPDMTDIVAQYELTKHTVTFDSRGGSTVEPEEVYHGHKATKPEDPVISGYDFNGWYIGNPGDDNPWIFENMTVNSDVTLSARWTKKVGEITVKYKTNFIWDGEKWIDGEKSITGLTEGEEYETLSEYPWSLRPKGEDDFTNWRYYNKKGDYEDYVPGSTIIIRPQEGTVMELNAVVNGEISPTN